jgi:hypothetical protein
LISPVIATLLLIFLFVKREYNANVKAAPALGPSFEPIGDPFAALGSFGTLCAHKERCLLAAHAAPSPIFMESPASGTPLTAFPGDEGYGDLLQGFVESSNVDSVREITNLIVAQRSYEMNSKVISTADEMLRTASDLR